MKYITDLNLSTQVAQIKSYFTSVFSNYLSKAGGTIGALTFNNNSAHINGGSALNIGCTTGASLELHKNITNDNTHQGQFILNASDGTNTASLVGLDTTLSWQNQLLMTFPQVEPVAVTFGDQITNIGGYQSAYRCGPLAIINWNFQISACTIPGGSVFITIGLPPIHPVMSVIADESRKYTHLAVSPQNGVGQVCFVLDATYSSPTWVNGITMYLTQG